MIALDTNILVRLIANDDPSQVAAARALILREAAIVQDSVVLETVWVLRKSYGFNPAQIASAMAILATTESVLIENRVRLFAALQAAQKGLDFADAYHLAGCPTETFASFDLGLVARAPGAFDQPRVISP
jgi:predicted nucleic acid-binding protein